MIDYQNMIECDDGQHLIQLDENISHYGWVFRKVEGGWLYSVRKATEHEMAHAKARQHLRKGAEQIAALWQPAEQHKGEQVASMPIERCYDVRAKMIIAFNEAKKAGSDLDDCLDSAYKAALRYSPNPLNATADRAEAERLRAVIEQQKNLIESLRAELVESHSIDASAEPSAPELTDDLREILGRPNFTCHFIAKALRVMGHSIAPKSEDEQAVVIHWLLGIYLKHGSDWRQRASAELEEASKALKS